jgi:hypothetical protein
VSRHQTAEFLGTKAPEKTPQGIAMWELGQAQKRRDQTVVNQRLGVLDPANSSYDSKEVSEKKVCGGDNLCGDNPASARRAAGNGEGPAICKMTERGSVHRSELNLISRMKNGTFVGLWAFLTILLNK